MTTPASKGGPNTIAEWLDAPEGSRFELIDGELIEKAAPTIEHGMAQSLTSSTIASAFHRRPGGPRGPGGWWIATEVDILLEERGFRPDLVGWRRERAPVMPKERPVALRPDWICEIVSDSNRSTDTVIKLRRYHQAAVPHYWLLDGVDRTLTVHRYASDGYLLVLRAEEHEIVRAEPFDAIEVEIRVLLGGDPS
jgi:Uma2 family endonuclease